MPEYILQCPACQIRTERFATFREREALRCGACGGALETHPDQFASQTFTVSSKQHVRGPAWGSRNGASKTMAFQESGIASVKQDCPSMDFKVKDGIATPVFHSDQHHRKCLKEFGTASERYKAERRAAIEAKAPKVNKTKVVREWMAQSRPASPTASQGVSSNGSSRKRSGGG
jgi:hypothetical protein